MPASALRLTSLLACIAYALACAPAPVIAEGEGEGEGDALDASDYCETIEPFFCDYYVRCGRMAVATVDECRPVFLEACNGKYEPSYASLASAELLALSASGVAACEEHLADVACEDQLLDLDGPCADMWVGTQPAGAACGFDIESFVCAPGSTCTLSLDLCGTCETIANDGDPCDGAGVTCARTSSCTDGICAPRVPVGGACTADGAPCVLGAQCRAGACAGPAYVDIGDPCDFDNRCPFASACIGGACVRSSELGGPCGPDRFCDSGFCEASTCVPFRAAGAACTQSLQCQSACIDGACLALPSACFDDDGVP